MLDADAIKVWIGLGLLVLLALAYVARPRRTGKALRTMDALPLPAGTVHAKPLLSGWERAAIDTLARQLPKTHRLCPQVRLLDMLSVRDGDRARWRTTCNRLGSKSVDFAVIDAAGRVVLVIELNDSSHDRPERRDRDKLVRAALDQAGIPLTVFRPGQPLDLGLWRGTDRDAGGPAAYRPNKASRLSVRA